MGTAAQHVLALPELLSTILQYVHAEQSLFKCMRVNSVWQHEATTLQWADLPRLCRLNTIHPQRQQYYANKVQSCSVTLDDDDFMFLDFKYRAIAFPRLRSVEFRLERGLSNCPFDLTLLHPFLPSTVRRIELSVQNVEQLKIVLDLVAVREDFVHVHSTIIFAIS
jgi:hypothetical protein